MNTKKYTKKEYIAAKHPNGTLKEEYSNNKINTQTYKKREKYKVKIKIVAYNPQSNIQKVFLKSEKT